MYKRPIPRVPVTGPVPHVDLKPTILTHILDHMNDPPPPITKKYCKHKPVREMKPQPEFRCSLEPVSINYRIENDYIHVYIDTLMWDIHRKYWKKCKKPPLHTYVKALRSFGYTEESVQKVIDEYHWWDTHEEELTKELERRWPGGKSKPPVQKKVFKAVKKLS